MGHSDYSVDFCATRLDVLYRTFPSSAAAYGYSQETGWLMLCLCSVFWSQEWWWFVSHVFCWRGYSDLRKRSGAALCTPCSATGISRRGFDGSAETPKHSTNRPAPPTAHVCQESGRILYMHLFLCCILRVICLMCAIFPFDLCETDVEDGAQRDFGILVEMVVYQSFVGACWMSDVNSEKNRSTCSE